MKNKESTWTKPKKETDPFEKALNGVVPHEIRLPNGKFEETDETERPDNASHLKSRLRQETDKLTLALNQTSYISKARLPWLKEVINGTVYPLTVDRFYEKLSLILDIRADGKHDNKKDLKAKLCAENGFQYFHIANQDELQDMLGKVRAH